MKERGMLAALARVAGRAGAEVMEKALQLYYALQAESTPGAAKRIILGALVYLMLPADLIPDWLPAAGFTDDLSVLTGALLTVNRYVTDDMVRRAAETRRRWFGASVEAPRDAA